MKQVWSMIKNKAKDLCISAKDYMFDSKNRLHLIVLAIVSIACMVLFLIEKYPIPYALFWVSLIDTTALLAINKIKELIPKVSIDEVKVEPEKIIPAEEKPEPFEKNKIEQIRSFVRETSPYQTLYGEKKVHPLGFLWDF